MANLIPPQARTGVKYEYWSRVAAVWLILIGTALIMVALLQSPTYVLIKDQLGSFDSRYQEVSNSNEQFKQSVEVIDRTNEISRFLNQETKNVLFTTLVREINSFVTEDIVITDMVITRKGGAIDTMSVSGVAASRTDLADFRIAIESSEHFNKAALPLSNLAKDVDIPFRISITLPQEPEV